MSDYHEKNGTVRSAVCRTITVDRNKTGYGFTLSRYVICSDTEQTGSKSVKQSTQNSNSSFQSQSSNCNFNIKSKKKNLIKNFQKKINQKVSKTGKINDAKSSIEIVFVKHVRVGGAAFQAGIDFVFFRSGV
jgi:hypothetical protein